MGDCTLVSWIWCDDVLHTSAWFSLLIQHRLPNVLLWIYTPSICYATLYVRWRHRVTKTKGMQTPGSGIFECTWLDSYITHPMETILALSCEGAFPGILEPMLLQSVLGSNPQAPIFLSYDCLYTQDSLRKFLETLGEHLHADDGLKCCLSVQAFFSMHRYFYQQSWPFRSHAIWQLHYQIMLAVLSPYLPRPVPGM